MIDKERIYIQYESILTHWKKHCILEILFIVLAGPYKCKRHTEAEQSKVKEVGGEAYCKSLGFIFTQGKNTEYPGCGDCWCCIPSKGSPLVMIYFINSGKHFSTDISSDTVLKIGIFGQFGLTFVISN